MHSRPQTSSNPSPHRIANPTSLELPESVWPLQDCILRGRPQPNWIQGTTHTLIPPKLRSADTHTHPTLSRLPRRRASLTTSSTATKSFLVLSLSNPTQSIYTCYNAHPGPHAKPWQSSTHSRDRVALEPPTCGAQPRKADSASSMVEPAACAPSKPSGLQSTSCE